MIMPGPAARRQRSPRPDPNLVPAASIQARLSAPDAPTAVAAARAQHRMGLGHGGPDARAGLAISLAEQPVRLSSKFLGAPIVLRSCHRYSAFLVARL